MAREYSRHLHLSTKPVDAIRRVDRRARVDRARIAGSAFDLISHGRLVAKRDSRKAIGGESVCGRELIPPIGCDPQLAVLGQVRSVHVATGGDDRERRGPIVALGDRRMTTAFRRPRGRDAPRPASARTGWPRGLSGVAELKRRSAAHQRSDTRGRSASCRERVDADAAAVRLSLSDCYYFVLCPGPDSNRHGPIRIRRILSRGVRLLAIAER